MLKRLFQTKQPFLFIESDLAVFYNIDDLHVDAPVVTIGSFDGVHCGHRALLQQVVDLACQNACRSVALTFATHPRMLLDASTPARWLLNTPDEKIALLSQYGIDDILMLPFDRTMAQLSASDFVRNVMVGKLKTKYWVAGDDHSFGKDKGGNAENISLLAQSYNIEIVKVNLKKYEGICVEDKQFLFAGKISSSSIRQALLDGDLETANRMLGYDYPISGKVVTGKQLGRTIGFPTANIEPLSCKLLPKEGVYSANIRLDGETLKGMLYIGKQPVMKTHNEQSYIEVHIFDFDRNIYGKELQVSLTHRIRDSIAFNNMEQLKAQLKKDGETSKRVNE
ncbi:riboflavin biosynthesis protein [Bacteroidia bacterium]|nr:riboflavin biosynthesis protein [Bacteroidia bacterium]